MIAMVADGESTPLDHLTSFLVLFIYFNWVYGGKLQIKLRTKIFSRYLVEFCGL